METPNQQLSLRYIHLEVLVSLVIGVSQQAVVEYLSGTWERGRVRGIIWSHLQGEAMKNRCNHVRRDSSRGLQRHLNVLKSGPQNAKCGMFTFAKNPIPSSSKF